MIDIHAPLWMSEFQKQFSELIRRPLDSSTGILRTSEPGELRHTIPLVLGKDDLEVYNRQYWFRLFTIMQNEFPLTARLMGHWSFNLLAQDYLCQIPPTHFDIQKIAEEFESFLSTSAKIKMKGFKTLVSYEILLQAAKIDTAFQEVFLAPSFHPLCLTKISHESFEKLQLRPSPIWRIIREDWQLIELRSVISDLKDDKACPLPKSRDKTLAWLIIRQNQGIAQVPLHPLQTQLYQSLTQHNISESLAIIEKKCLEEDLPHLPSLTQKWMQESVNLQLWSA